MNRLFSKSKRSKEKEKRRVEQNKEDDILYGRRNRAPPTDNSSGSRKPPRSTNAHTTASRGELAQSLGSHSTSNNSMSSSYYRAETILAVKGPASVGGGARENHVGSNVSIPEVAVAVGAPAAAVGGGGVGSHSRGHLKSNDHRDGDDKNADWDAASGTSSGGGKTSGMSREEIDNLTKRRLKSERKKQTLAASMREPSRKNERKNQSSHSASVREPAKSSFSERLLDQAVQAGTSYEEDSREKSHDAQDVSDRTKSRKHHKHRKSHREHKPREPRDSDLDMAHYGDLAINEQDDDKDGKTNETFGQQPRNGATKEHHQNNSENDDLEQRHHQRQEQEEKDRKMKESIRHRRRVSQEQIEKDMKLKLSMKQQKTSAATEARASGAPDRQQDDEFEQRRLKQREQEEKDRKMKQSIREQTSAAKELQSSAVLDRNVDEEFEQRRLKRLEKADNNRYKMQTAREQSHNVTTTDIQNRKHVSFGDADIDPFEAATAALQLTQARPRERDVVPFDHKNLIDLHIAQFRATSKTTTVDDEEYDNFGEVDHQPSNPNLEEFEKEEAQRNMVRRMSRRVSATTMKINAWHQKYSMKKALELAERTREMEWASSFYHADPRWQIMKFFDEVAREGGKAEMDENLATSPLANLFNKASVFTVWRPTSDEAIKNMMLGKATGKGLDIKGKSAKRGNISSYVPFIQIYEEPHKEHVRAYIKDGKVVRVFYQSEEARNEAHMLILDIKDFMLFAAQDAMRVLSDEYADPEEQELAMKHLMYDDDNLGVNFVDTYINCPEPVFGLDITERLFWESNIIMQNCSRPAGTEWDIGRGSELAFMDMNFKSIRHAPEPGERRVVVYQMSKCSPMEPRTLLIAYEENGRVKPVVSDFDCFLLGSRGVKYQNPIPQDQVELVKWSVKNISQVLDERATSDSTAGWMETWFKVLKKAAIKGYYPKTPPYGNGDPKSYEIIEVAVSRLQSTGCVRHGAECFNWFFPQEIDEDFLVVSDTLPGNLKWKKVKVPELQDILITKIDEGFTFPINPKWVLCDPGWRRVYDKLLASQKPNVQDSLKCWLPPETGLREEIDSISARHPLGFEGDCAAEKTEGTEVMDQLQDDLERYFKLQRAWRKLRLVLHWIRFVREKRREREEKEMEALARFSGDEVRILDERP